MSNKKLQNLCLTTLSLCALLILSACEVKVEDANGVIKIKTTDENDPTWVDSEQLICRDKSNSNSFTEIIISKLHIAYALDAKNEADMMPCYVEEGQVGGCLIPPYEEDSNFRNVTVTQFDLANGEATHLLNSNITGVEKSYGILFSEGSTSVKLIEESSKRAILVKNGVATNFSCETDGKQTRITGPTAEYFYCNSLDGKYNISASINAPYILNSTAQSKSLTSIPPSTNLVSNVYVYNYETGESYTPSNLVREVNPQSVTFSSNGFRLKASRFIDNNGQFAGSIEFNDLRLELNCSNGYYDDNIGVSPETEPNETALNQ